VLLVEHLIKKNLYFLFSILLVKYKNLNTKINYKVFRIVHVNGPTL